MKKTLSFGIPCYNSAAYMDTCIRSILEGSDYAKDVEIIIVDDGSTKDETPQKADEWAAKHPDIIKVIHQENGGHGAAVLAALDKAQGLYYKVVDSDDWLNAAALKKVLKHTRAQHDNKRPIDLFVTNYVYEHTVTNTRHTVRYHNELPVEKICTWDDTRMFRPGEYLLMHSLLYRTALLKQVPLPIPRHTFYVDNIYAYVPLPRVKTLCYLDVDFYRYFIGRDDQSVNEKTMVSRIDQQLRITRIMTDEFKLYEDVSNRKLRRYMLGYLTIMYAICTIFSKLSDKPEAPSNLRALWRHLRDHDPVVYRKVRFGLIGTATNLPGRIGNKMSLGFYRIAQKIVKFN